MILEDEKCHLQGLRQVPVEQCDERLNVCCQQGVSQVAVECQASLIDLHITITIYEAKPSVIRWWTKARADRVDAIAGSLMHDNLDGQPRKMTSVRQRSSSRDLLLLMACPSLQQLSPTDTQERFEQHGMDSCKLPGLCLLDIFLTRLWKT